MNGIKLNPYIERTLPVSKRLKTYLKLTALLAFFKMCIFKIQIFLIYSQPSIQNK